MSNPQSSLSSFSNPSPSNLNRSSSKSKLRLTPKPMSVVLDKLAGSFARLLNSTTTSSTTTSSTHCSEIETESAGSGSGSACSGSGSGSACSGSGSGSACSGSDSELPPIPSFAINSPSLHQPSSASASASSTSQSSNTDLTTPSPTPSNSSTQSITTHHMNCFSPSPYLLHQLPPTLPQSPCLLLSASADSLHLSTSLTPVGHPTASIHSSTKPMLRLNSNLPPSTLLSGDATPTELISPSHSIRTQKALSPSSSNTHTPTSSELQLSPTKQLRTQSILGTRPPWEVPRSQQRWSSGSAISPKDAVSREAVSPFSRLPHFSPFSPQPASHCPMSSPHRRTHSGLPHLPSCRSPCTGSKRVSWNPLPASSSSARFSWASAYMASSPDPINLASPAGQALSEKQIESIESLGVKFIDRASLGIASSPMLNATVASCSRSRSGSTSSHSRHGLNRNSLSSIKRRRSVKTPAPGPLPSPVLKPIPVDAGRLLEILNRAGGGKGKENEHESQSESPRALLIIDLRSLNAYLGSEGRLKGSINVNFPSLLIKRFRKGHQSQFQLSSFITTDAGKRFYAALEPNLSEIEICVIDDEAEGIGAVVVDALSKARGRADGLYLLSEPFADLRARPDALNWLVAGEAGQDPGVGIAQQGLRRLEPSCGPHLNLPSLDTTVNGTENTLRLSRKVKPPKLRKIETSETYLSARPSPTSASNRIPSPLGPNQPRRPGSGSSERQNQIPGRFRFPMTNLDDSSRATASPTRDDPPKPAAVPMTDDRFKISTIIPGFLFLGPEPIESTDFSALEALGVKRILNVATECDGSEGCDRAFIEKYIKIPFRDFVEEVGVQGRIEQANKLLDDASLHSAPVYVHCKAGKSRSVTIVLAYLIHRFRWTLKDSYAHVSERRKGICPNIGFLAELMSFEERVLGSRTQVMSRSMSYQYPSTQHISSLSCGGSAGVYSQQTSSQHERTANGRVRSVALAREEVWPLARQTREG